MRDTTRVRMIRATVIAASGLLTGMLAPMSAAAAPNRAHLSDTAPACTFEQLDIGLHGEQAGLGHVGKYLTVTNSSDGACIVSGYANVVMEDANHDPLPTIMQDGPTYFDPDPGASSIELTPGETASADLEWGHVDSPGTAYPQYLRLTPPDTTEYRTVLFPMPGDMVSYSEFSITALARNTP